MMFLTADFCITCETLARPRQEAVHCDGCNRWQHRSCNTGISRVDYRAAVQPDAELQWQCSQCYDAVPLTSTWLEESASLQISDPSASTMVENETVAPEPLPAVLVEEESTVYDPSTVHQESSIADPPPHAEMTRQAPVTYQIASNIKGKRKLIDSDGYSYNVKRQRGEATDWQCIVRPKVNVINDVIMVSY